MISAESGAESFFGEATQKGKYLVRRTVAASVVGGTVSEIGGGKFANGAVTGAMVHLFNAEGGGSRMRPGSGKWKAHVKANAEFRDGVYNILSAWSESATEMVAELNKNVFNIGDYVLNRANQATADILNIAPRIVNAANSKFGLDVIAANTPDRTVFNPTYFTTKPVGPPTINTSIIKIYDAASTASVASQRFLDYVSEASKQRADDAARRLFE